MTTRGGTRAHGFGPVRLLARSLPLPPYSGPSRAPRCNLAWRRRAAVLRPGDGGMLANLGEMLRAAGDLAGASATRQMAALLGRYEEPGPCAGVLWNSTPGSATHGGVGAADALRRAGILAPDSELVWRNAAAVAQQAGDWQTLEESDRQLLRVLGLDADAAARPAGESPLDARGGHPRVNPLDVGLPVEDLEVRTRVELADAVQRQGDRPEEAWALFDAALRVAPEDARALIGAGVAAQHLGLLDQAAELYTSAIAAAETAPPDDAAANEAIGRQARVNLAAVFHERGDMLSAIFMYKAVLETAPGDTQALNNLGAALVTVGRHDEAVEVLERCLAADSDQPQALTNLALHYGNEGEMARAAEYSAAARALLARRPDERSRNARAGLLLREVTSMSPVVTSTVDVCTVRAALAVRVATLLHALRGNSTYRAQRRVHEPVSDVEQVHFYLPYAGLNDRPLQEAIVQVFELVAPTVGVIAPHAAQASLECLGGPAAALGKRLGKRKTRVGFTSKFFGEHEPHGLLLEGVVEHLPRDRFEVYVLPIASPGRAAASELLTRAADLVVPLSLNFAQARAALVSAQLDVLVFADLLSEPMSYFLGFSRFAPIQLAFWGNPISSGRGSIDYFVSADRMEHPFRTTLPASEEPYTEQVLTLDGQGIW